ncbi:host attachment protein [Alteromonas sp. ASW11-130]|uniref:host attachment protein n=1 Tax=Alteromonas sp. ASW11-130 TaxID=3015775 RepID=UPI0022427EC4|nr:host attachment protein [Alteromonas sp. ASW11-130]MCW8091150.1 host attachment protein [Alteromonas sp. ASW11-130]
MIGKSYLVVANRSEAKIFQVRNNATELEPVTVLNNRDGRKSDSDIVTDRPGSISSPSALVPGVDTMSRKDAAEHEADEFSASVVEWLDKKRCSEKIYHIDFIAEPAFLGKMRKKMNSQLEKIVGTTVTKDVVNSDESTWLNYIKEAENPMATSRPH